MAAGSGASMRARHSVELSLGGACELDCAVCDCRARPSREAPQLLARGGARLVLRGSLAGAPRAFEQAIRMARATGFGEIVVRTNALAYREPGAAATFAALGAHAVLVPIFSANARVHDRIAGRKDALAHALVGMRALAAAGLRVEIEVPLLSPRLQDLVAIVELSHRAVPALRAARFFVPPQRVPAPLAPPRWDEGGEPLAAALRACRALGVAASLRPNDGVPLCALRSAPDLLDAYRFDPRAKVRLATTASYGEVCVTCAVRAQCSGRTASYADAHGQAGLVPWQRKPRAMYEQRNEDRPAFTAEHRRAASEAGMVVLRPTVNCNQDCQFCSANETSNNVWTDTGTMLRAIARIARRGVSRLSFSGGEPTLARDLVHYVAAAHRLGIREIELVTNGVLLDDPARVEALRAAGLTHAFVSLHAHDERLSRMMTRKTDDHGRTVQAVKHLLAAGVCVVLNHVITSRNYPYLRHFVEFVHGELGGRAGISFAFVTPQYKALEDLSLVPRLSVVAPYVRRALARAVELGQRVVVGSRQGIPPCFLGEFAAWSDIVALVAEAQAEDAPQKQRAPACERCKFTRQCTGLWRPYVALYGTDELVPVPGEPLSDDDVVDINRTAQPFVWVERGSFEDVHPRMRDRDAEARSAAFEETLAPAPPLRALPLLSSQRSRPVRLALIGTGRQARRLAHAARAVPGVSIDAVASPNALEADLRDFAGCPAYRSLDEVLVDLRPEAVVIAAATDAHRALALEALARGAPLLLEKPLARTVVEAEELVQAAAARPDVALLPAHNMVFSAGLDALFDAAGRGAVAYLRRCPRGSLEAPRWSRAQLYELLHHALSVVGRAVGGGLPEVTDVTYAGEAAPSFARLVLAYPQGTAELTFDFDAPIDETVVVRRGGEGQRSDVVWTRAGASTTLREAGRERAVPSAGSDVERMLAHFRDVVLGQATPMVTPREALDVMLAARLAVDALDSAGAPFDRRDAPRHVVSPSLAVFPRRSGAR